MNYLNCEIFLFSPSEIVDFIFIYIDLPILCINQLQSSKENYLNYIFSESLVYNNFNQITICFSICKNLIENLDYSQRINYSQNPDENHSSNTTVTSLNQKLNILMTQLDVNLEEVEICSKLINDMITIDNVQEDLHSLNNDFESNFGNNYINAYFNNDQFDNYYYNSSHNNYSLQYNLDLENFLSKFCSQNLLSSNRVVF